MKAILIDSTTATISEVEHDGSLDSLYKLIGCEQIEATYPFKTRDCVYIDEEGGLKPNRLGFVVKGFHSPFRGRGLVVGTDREGNTVAPKVTELDVAMVTEFVAFKKEIQFD